MTKTSAKVIADSISPEGHRLLTVEATYHRFVHSEMMTHKTFNINSASSRAIPISKTMKSYNEDTAWPIEWPAEQSGMSGGDTLEDPALKRAKWLWVEVQGTTHEAITEYVETCDSLEQEKIHKSLLNRLMEPMQWHTVLITGTQWENFFDQRCSSAAQPELRVVAELIRDAVRDSEPTELVRGQWHTPFVDGTLKTPGLERPLQISAARCARLSYMTHEKLIDIIKDVQLFEKLVENHHWSPLGHVATPDNYNIVDAEILDPFTFSKTAQYEVPMYGNLLGWQSYRHVIEARKGIVTYR